MTLSFTCLKGQEFYLFDYFLSAFSSIHAILCNMMQGAETQVVCSCMS